jgi:hypothetical protein
MHFQTLLLLIAMSFLGCEAGKKFAIPAPYNEVAGKCKLSFQLDGDIVVRKHNKAVWSADCAAKVPGGIQSVKLVLDSDFGRASATIEAVEKGTGKVYSRSAGKLMELAQQMLKKYSARGVTPFLKRVYVFYEPKGDLCQLKQNVSLPATAESGPRTFVETIMSAK